MKTHDLWAIKMEEDYILISHNQFIYDVRKYMSNLRQKADIYLWLID